MEKESVASSVVLASAVLASVASSAEQENVSSLAVLASLVVVAS